MPECGYDILQLGVPEAKCQTDEHPTHHTHIYVPNSQGVKVYENTQHGNAGMAVGGSGDVLTGIILALLAQHYTAEQAAVIGVWLHALAADIALSDGNRDSSLLPSDIIAHLGAAFNASR